MNSLLTVLFKTIGCKDWNNFAHTFTDACSKDFMGKLLPYIEKYLNFLKLYEILLYKIDIFICIKVVPSIFSALLILPYIATKMISTLIKWLLIFLKPYTCIYWQKSYTMYTHENFVVASKCCI